MEELRVKSKTHTSTQQLPSKTNYQNMSYNELIDIIREPSNIKLINRLLIKGEMKEEGQLSNDHMQLLEIYKTIKDIDEDILTPVRNISKNQANIDNSGNIVNGGAIVSFFQPSEQSDTPDETILDYKTSELNQDYQPQSDKQTQFQTSFQQTYLIDNYDNIEQIQRRYPYPYSSSQTIIQPNSIDIKPNTNTRNKIVRVHGQNDNEDILYSFQQKHNEHQMTNSQKTESNKKSSNVVSPNDVIQTSFVGSNLVEERTSLDGEDYESNEELSQFYPQSNNWDNIEEEEFPSSTTSKTTLIATTTTTPVRILQETTTTATRIKDIEDLGSAFLQSGSSFKDTAQFKALVAQLNNTLELIRSQNKEKRKKINFSQTKKATNKTVGEKVEDEQEIIFVNIWNNVNGKLKHKGKKEVLKKTFNEMQMKNNFSILIESTESVNSKDIPVSFDKLWKPEKADPIGGVGNPSLKKPKVKNTLYQNVNPSNEFFQGVSNPNLANRNALLGAEAHLNDFVQRNGIFPLKQNSKLELPSSLKVLIPSTAKPISPVYTAYQNPWLNFQTKENDETRTTSTGSLAQGGSDKQAISEFGTSHLKQEERDEQRILLNPVLIRRPISQLERTTRQPNFRPIPIPDVLRPKKVLRLPEINLQTSTTLPPSPFDTNYGLKLPSQLAHLLDKRQQPLQDDHIVPKNPTQPSKFNIPSTLLSKVSNEENDVNTEVNLNNQ